MNIHLTIEQEAQLAEVAAKAGIAPEQVVADVVTRYLDEEACFIAAVKKSLEAAGRGELLEEEAMDACVEAMLRK